MVNLSFLLPLVVVVVPVESWVVMALLRTAHDRFYPSGIRSLLLPFKFQVSLTPPFVKIYLKTAATLTASDTTQTIGAAIRGR